MLEKKTTQIGLPEFLAVSVGGAFSYHLWTHMSGGSPAFACAAVIALLTVIGTRLTLPISWWASVGVIAGSVIGTSDALGADLSQMAPEARVQMRVASVVILAIAGLFAGFSLGRDSDRPGLARPAELLRHASAVTLVIYAVVVTARFPAGGIDAVRALSSRLSTMTTIIATSLAVPGWFGYLIGKRLDALLRATQPPRADGGSQT
jgi:hypothetical protein